MKIKSDINYKVKHLKKSFHDFISSLHNKGFSTTCKNYKRQILLALGVLLVVIGVIALITTCVKLYANDVSDSQNVNVEMSDMTYIPKELTFELDKDTGETIKDTHGDIVINRIGNISKLDGDKSFATEDDNIYIYYTFTFNSENSSFDGEVPYVTAVGFKDGKTEVLQANNVIKSNDGWLSLDKSSVEIGKTYEAYASFNTEDFDEFYFQFMNADGNMTILKVVE